MKCLFAEFLENRDFIWENKYFLARGLTAAAPNRLYYYFHQIEKRPVERFEFQARNGKVYGILRKRCPNTVKTKLFQGGRKSLGKAGEPHAVRRSLSGHSCQTRRQKPMVCATFSIVFLDFGALNGAAPECPSWALSGTERH